jgi:hypothetical protein
MRKTQLGAGSTKRTIYFDKRHPSAMILPVLKPAP